MSLGKEEITREGFYSVRHKKTEEITVVKVEHIFKLSDMTVFFIGSDEDLSLPEAYERYDFLHKLELE